jgi:anthranilate synthase component 2
MKILLVDHEDSFVYNLYQALGRGGAEVKCVRYTTPPLAARRYNPDGIVLSPGPGHPSDRKVTGLARSLLGTLAHERPTLGVCLGHQLIGEYFGGRVVASGRPVHGETTAIRHTDDPLFAGVPSPFEAARYHSLVIDPESLPPELTVTARSGGTIMGIRHRTWPIHGVQFHPESYLTRYGERIVRNFLTEVGR